MSGYIYIASRLGLLHDSAPDREASTLIRNKGAHETRRLSPCSEILLRSLGEIAQRLRQVEARTANTTGQKVGPGRALGAQHSILQVQGARVGADISAGCSLLPRIHPQLTLALTSV